LKIIKTENVHRDELAGFLPNAYRKKLSFIPLEAECYVLVRFSREAVIYSRHVAKALRDLNSKDKAIFVGRCFTKESQALVRDSGNLILSLSRAKFTDKSYEEIKVFIRSKVKRPEFFPTIDSSDSAEGSQSEKNNPTDEQDQ
jgi:hypothetical protein